MRLRFDSPLEEQYLREAAPARLKHLLFSGRLSLILFVGFFPLDWILVPDMLRESLFLRVMLIAPIGIGGMWLIKRHEQHVLNLHMRTYDWTVLASGLVAALVVCYLGMATHSRYAAMYQGGLLPILLYGNLVQRLRFLYATAFSVMLLLMHAISTTLAQHPYQPVALPLSLMLYSVAVYTLYSNYRLEMDERHRYLQTKRTQALREQLQQTQAQLADAARRDPLTGAANRRHFDEYMQALWLDRHLDGGTVSMMLVDVDHFKAYNDRYGHPAGDECLRYVVKELTRHLPGGHGLVARWGGEEFAVVLPGIDSHKAYAIAQAMTEGIQGLGLRHEASATAATITVSVGLATLEPRLIREPIDNLVARADAALYGAKRHGRNRVERQDVSVA